LRRRGGDSGFAGGAGGIDVVAWVAGVLFLSSGQDFTSI
jgi:hypothetical protein